MPEGLSPPEVGIVGISTHFPLRAIRYGLVGLGGLMLVLSIVQLTQLPGPPT
jgi:hypothetical protein